jgi:hypothetical protein
VLGRLVYLGRETRSPAVIAVSDGAVVDLDLHGKTSVSCAAVSTEPQNIVLIHGMWMTLRSWESAPLLLLVGGKNNISPPALNRKLLKLYGKSAARTESKEYPDRTHFTAGMDGWEQVADDALSWATA